MPILSNTDINEILSQGPSYQKYSQYSDDSCDFQYDDGPSTSNQQYGAGPSTSNRQNDEGASTQQYGDGRASRTEQPLFTVRRQSTRFFKKFHREGLRYTLVLELLDGIIKHFNSN